MKKTIKVLALIICLILAVSILTGCGVKKETNKDADQENVSSEEKNEKVLTRGKWENNVYKNDFANITFKLPSGWVYSSDKEIAELMNIDESTLSEDNLSKLAEQASLYDMVSNDPSTGASVMVMFEKSVLTVTTDFYMNNLKKGLEETDELNYTIGDVTTEKIAGEEYQVLTTSIPEYNMVQKYYIKPEGKYFVDIIVTYIEGSSNIDDIISNFQ